MFDLVSDIQRQLFILLIFYQKCLFISSADVTLLIIVFVSFIIQAYCLRVWIPFLIGRYGKEILSKNVLVRAKRKGCFRISQEDDHCVIVKTFLTGKS